MSTVRLSMPNESESTPLVGEVKRDGLKTWKLLLVALAVVAVLGVALNAPWQSAQEGEFPTVLKKLELKHVGEDAGPVMSHGDAGHHFSYHGSTGPSHWSSIVSTCGGSKQSPVNIVTRSVRGRGKKAVMACTAPLNGGEMSHNAHTVDVSFPGKKNFVKMGGVKYPFAQFHFHHPSEHKINGKHADAEVHFVHFNKKNGKYVVIGLMCYVSNEHSSEEVNELLEEVIVDSGKFPMKNGQATQFQMDKMNILRELHLKKGRGAFQYEGSLTTPPCTEAVSWFVMKKKVMISKKVLKKLKKSFGYNSRPVNPLNGRRVKNGLVKGKKIKSH